MNEPRLTELLDRYLDRGLASADMTELEALLLVSEEARRAFWERARLHSALRLQAHRLRGQRLAHVGARDPSAHPSAGTEPGRVDASPSMPITTTSRWNRWAVGTSVFWSWLWCSLFGRLKGRGAGTLTRRILFMPSCLAAMRAAGDRATGSSGVGG